MAGNFSAGLVVLGTTRGAWVRGWQLLIMDGFEVDVPDSKANAAECGYAGPGEKSAGVSQGAGGGVWLNAVPNAVVAAESMRGWRVRRPSRASRIRDCAGTGCSPPTGTSVPGVWAAASATGAAPLWRARSNWTCLSSVSWPTALV